MKIAKDTVVTLQCNIHTAQGETIDAGAQTVSYLHGGYYGIFPKVEAELTGKSIGDAVSVTLQPADHYGERQESRLQRVARTKLPADLVQNEVLEMRNSETGETHLVAVAELDDTHAVLDGNHPLAGMVLIFNATVQAVRAATKEEIAHGHYHDPNAKH